MSTPEHAAAGRPSWYRRKLVLVGMVLGLYLGSYAVLSANGRYYARPSGEIRYGFGMAVFDLSVWFPAGVIWERRKGVSGEYIIDANVAGWFYLPLLAVDRRWIHRTTNVLDTPED